MISEPDVAQRLPEQIEKDIKALDWRDLQLWGIGACVLLALAAGFVLLLAPQLLWKFSDSTRATSLPQYTWGLIVLLLLLNAQTLHQRFRLQQTRAELVRQLRMAERAAQVDPLTGVFNRRYMEMELEKEISRAERYHRSLCLAVIDVDRFKEFNTRFGHVEGDRALRVVASLLCKNFRAADTVIRYGGDEFIIVMPETDLRQATVAVQRLQKHYFSQWNRANGDCGYSITVTCGVAEFKPGMTANELICGADRVMLDAKSHGMEGALAADAVLAAKQPSASTISTINAVQQPCMTRGAQCPPSRSGVDFLPRGQTPRVRSSDPHLQCLLVCHDPDTVRIFRFATDDLKIELEVATDAESAIERLHEHKFDSVIVDCDEVAGGTAVLAGMRQTPSNKRAIGVALIKHASLQSVFKRGAQFTVEKPITLNRAMHALRAGYPLMADERRRYFRHPVDTTGYLSFGVVRQLACKITNISDGGMAITLKERISPAGVVDVSFELPGIPQTLEATGEFAWVDDKCNAGLRFTHVPHDSEKQLRRWLERIAPPRETLEPSL